MAIVDFDPSKHFHGRERWWPRSGRHEDSCRTGFEELQAAMRMTDEQLMNARYESWKNYELLWPEEQRRRRLNDEPFG